MEVLQSTAEEFLGLFYIRRPSASYLPPLEPPPNYIEQAVPFLAVLIVVEMVIRWLKGRPTDIADATCSMSQGMMQETVRYTLRSIEGWAYVYVWQHWRLFDMPWNTTTSFWLTMLAVDFGYYWFHRGSHEINIIWASHQVHHSSEHFNLSTAFRQSIVQQYFQWVPYIPLAFIGVAPSMFFTHYMFNLLYQFWIHSELVKSIGPLEHILNTPSHHRVHHGSNVKYLDKNYAGVLIVWDRLFGTFCWEEETPTYGLVHNIESYDVWTIQLAHFRWILSDVRQQVGWRNKLKRVLYGPGWVPGTGRLGDASTFPEPDPARPRFDTRLPLWLKLYIFVHLLAVMVGPSTHFAQMHMVYPVPTCLLYSAALIYQLSCVGWLLDASWWAPLAELLRCGLALASLGYLSWLPAAGVAAARVLYAGSLLFWILRSFSGVLQTAKTKTA